MGSTTTKAKALLVATALASGLGGAAAVTAITATTATAVTTVAKRGADDPAGDQRRGRGTDDPAGHA